MFNVNASRNRFKNSCIIHTKNELDTIKINFQPKTNGKQSWGQLKHEQHQESRKSTNNQEGKSTNNE